VKKSGKVIELVFESGLDGGRGTNGPMTCSRSAWLRGRI
jgi:hypothetical protein